MMKYSKASEKDEVEINHRIVAITIFLEVNNLKDVSQSILI